MCERASCKKQKEKSGKTCCGFSALAVWSFDAQAMRETARPTCYADKATGQRFAISLITTYQKSKRIAERKQHPPVAAFGDDRTELVFSRIGERVTLCRIANVPHRAAYAIGHCLHHRVATGLQRQVDVSLLRHERLIEHIEQAQTELNVLRFFETEVFDQGRIIRCSC